MKMTIPQPNITAQTEREQMIQMRSYLYQMAQQLQWAFNNINTSGGGQEQQAAPAPVQGAGNVKLDPNKTFGAIKDLIIKSADIVESYYTQISNRLEGMYVAVSDFGTYKESTSQEINASNTKIEQLFTNNREINLTLDRVEGNTGSLTESVGKLEQNTQNVADAVNQVTSGMESLGNMVEQVYAATVETSAYIKTGLLYEDEQGIPVYGLEVGQTNDVQGVNVFTKFARFSADRLSFYDRNDTEVAYISDYKLYITNAEITGSLFLAGKFKIYYKNGLAFQWIGGNANGGWTS